MNGEASERADTVVDQPDSVDAAQRRDRLFAEHRAYLFAVAYRMLGVAEDAEDVLQDAWIRFREVRSQDLQQPRSFLVTMVTRLCIDQLRSARRQREEYVGMWLPEPVPTDQLLADDLLQEAESASFAFLLLLERLSPRQRAVLVLHSVFDYSHDEIGRALDCSTAASRQTLRRARQRLGRNTQPQRLDRQQSQDLLESFVAAARSGEIGGYLQAMAPDVVLISDGGGKVRAVPRPLVGRQLVSRFLSGVSRNRSFGPVILTELNNRPALLVHMDEQLVQAMLMDLTQEGVTAIYVVRNPDKLRRLSELASTLG